jgi:hypothetical protein
MRRLWLFLLTCGLAGLGAVVGSMLGHFLGGRALFVGALAGGLLGVLGAARVATARGLVPPARFWPMVAGGSAGFLVAAAIAVRTLSTPLGPVLSVALVGAGALIGAGRQRSASAF